MLHPSHAQGPYCLLPRISQFFDTSLRAEYIELKYLDVVTLGRKRKLAATPRLLVQTRALLRLLVISQMALVVVLRLPIDSTCYGHRLIEAETEQGLPSFEPYQGMAALYSGKDPLSLHNRARTRETGRVFLFSTPFPLRTLDCARG